MGTNIFFNVCLILMFLLAFFLLVKRYKDQRNTLKKFMQIENQSVFGVVDKHAENILGKYKAAFVKALDKTKLSVYAEQLYLLVLGLSVCCFVGFTIYSKWFIGVFLALLLNILLYCILTLLIDNREEALIEQLPLVIEELLKEFTRATDIRVVISKIVHRLPSPIKDEIEMLSKDLLIATPEKALISFRQRVYNIWVYSLVTSLVVYTQSGKLEDVKFNLREISHMLKSYAKIKTQSITDKKYSSVINYVLVLAALLGFVGNLVINPVSYDFFFNTLVGLLCLFVGIVSLGLTVLLNISMTLKRRSQR